MWHEKLKKLVAENKIVLLGVAQEQHAERCQLYSNWQDLDWPILHDPINSLGCNAVPITIAIDENGVVQHTRPKPDWVKNTFLARPVNTTKPSSKATPEIPDIAALRKEALSTNTSKHWQALGDAIMLWKPDSAAHAIEAYRKAQALKPSPKLDFRLGVAFRHRSESPSRTPSDFTSAIQHWEAALKANPNQYIWRRRIQQYGPRLDKPYPFYDWVNEAISAITDRDGTAPPQLRIPLTGAEIAQPSRATAPPPQKSSEQTSPDPEGRIQRDVKRLVRIHPTVVASSNPKHPTSRLHLEFTLDTNALWNNEAEPLQVWLEQSDEVSYQGRRLLHQPDVDAAESREMRTLEVEFSKKTHKATAIQGFALYYICEKSTQQCILLRQDFTIPIRIK